MNKILSLIPDSNDSYVPDATKKYRAVWYREDSQIMYGDLTDLESAKAEVRFQISQGNFAWVADQENNKVEL